MKYLQNTICTTQAQPTAPADLIFKKRFLNKFWNHFEIQYPMHSQSLKKEFAAENSRDAIFWPKVFLEKKSAKLNFKLCTQLEHLCSDILQMTQNLTQFSHKNGVIGNDDLACALLPDILGSTPDSISDDFQRMKIDICEYYFEKEYFNNVSNVLFKCTNFGSFPGDDCCSEHIVPISGKYRITAYGGCTKLSPNNMNTNENLLKIGAKECKLNWPFVLAKGAMTVSTFDLAQGDVLKIYVGKSGKTVSDGSGGTYVLSESEILMVAGGAGGVLNYDTAERSSGSITQFGNVSDTFAKNNQTAGTAGSNYNQSSGGSGLYNSPRPIKSEGKIIYKMPETLGMS